MTSARSRAAAAEAVLRGVAATSVPERLASHLVDLASAWLGGQSWALVSADEGRGTVWLAERSIPASRRAAVAAVAEKAILQSQVIWTDLNTFSPRKLRNRFAALAIPLRGHGRAVGVLVGLERFDGTRLPHADVSDARLSPLLELVDGMAGAIDTALRLKRAEMLSAMDDLTGLFNSRFMTSILRREVKRSVRTGRPVSVLFIDLDGFKGINDRHGHLWGSRALVEAAARITSGARETDLVARYGGDEFALILPETPPEGALHVATRVRELIANEPFLVAEGVNFVLTASVGIATLPHVATTPHQLLAAADAAMYAVKQRGKNGIEVAQPGMVPAAVPGEFSIVPDPRLGWAATS